MPRGDKPTTVALALKDGWVYEDTLPESITKAQYDWWHQESLVLDGVRMGPSLANYPPSRVWVKLLSGGDLSAYKTDIRKEHFDKQPVYEYVPAVTPPDTPIVAREVAEFEYCPTCAGELDTGFECKKCGRDWRSWVISDEVQRRIDQVAEAAVEWHQAGREGGEWFDAAEKLSTAINSLLELRDKPAATTSPDETAVGGEAFIRKVAALPCARVDGDECAYFEKGITNYCASCHARELLVAPVSPAVDDKGEK